MDINKQLELANAAYRAGNPIMGDAEYDALERLAGLENINDIGEKHSPQFTIHHPFIMGSLSKVQTHRDKDGIIDWDDISKSINVYVGDNSLIITPKYDGCSFEVYVKGDDITISTRGDGHWGRDIRQYVIDKIPSNYLSLPHQEYTLRGEMLIDRVIFKEKYSDDFVNERSFVAGLTGSDWTEKTAMMSRDLSIVIYDYRYNDGDGWIETNWEALPHSTVLPSFFMHTEHLDIEDIYWKFNDYREKKCRYTLDGIVIKPANRVGDFVNARPKDCVALKFLPMTAETTVTDVCWELGKTGEYFPLVYFDEIKLDGKRCVKASGHNYGVIIDRRIFPGAKIVVSMAGDIIPYIYKVTDSGDGDRLIVPQDTYIDGCHLMKHMNDDERVIEEFRHSCLTLDVPGLGDAVVNRLIEMLKADCQGDEFFGIEPRQFPFTIFALSSIELAHLIGGKAGQKISKAYQDIIDNISLSTIIQSLNFSFCGKRTSEAVAKYLIDGESSFESLCSDGWSWATDIDSIQYKKLMMVLLYIGKDIDYFRDNVNVDSTSNRICIMMTGEPNDYDNKADFLRAHSEYEETTSWKKCQVLFTNSMESNTAKMKKAKEKGIEIRIY